jgi:hypothetical protein
MSPLERGATIVAGYVNSCGNSSSHAPADTTLANNPIIMIDQPLMY